jgi:hypothetical protein
MDSADSVCVSALSAALSTFDVAEEQAHDAWNAAEAAGWSGLQGTLTQYNELAFLPTRRDYNRFTPKDFWNDFEEMDRYYRERKEELDKPIPQQIQDPEIQEELKRRSKEIDDDFQKFFQNQQKNKPRKPPQQNP